MPHSRTRHVTDILLKKLSFSPVVAIQGARQTGKSFLVRELLSQDLPGLHYETFDRESTRAFASSNPETFLSQCVEAHPLAIDEAQKVPKIFDAIKYVVDKKRKPGSYLLLGSTEFSKATLIRESLTGRISKVRLFPLNIAESLEISPNRSKSSLRLQEKPRVDRAQLTHFLKRGGMPGTFAVRSESEREAILRDWLDVTTERDALMLPGVKLDANLCRRILELVARLEEPSAGNIAKQLRRDLRRVKTHLDGLVTLFVLNVLPPHPAGTGKPFYFLADVALATLLGADFERQLYTWFVQEQLSQHHYRLEPLPHFSYYRTPKGKLVHWICESVNGHISALKILSEETTRDRDLEILKALREKLSLPEMDLVALGADRQNRKKESIQVYPWESIA